MGVQLNKKTYKISSIKEEKSPLAVLFTDHTITADADLDEDTISIFTHEFLA